MEKTLSTASNEGNFMIFAYNFDYNLSGNFSIFDDNRPALDLITIFVDDMRRNKRRYFTAFDVSTTPPTLIRRDISLGEIRKIGGEVPKLYVDELGDMRGERDQIIMAGPRNIAP